jgi:hypothetical protein
LKSFILVSMWGIVCSGFPFFKCKHWTSQFLRLNLNACQVHKDNDRRQQETKCVVPVKMLRGPM